MRRRTWTLEKAVEIAKQYGKAKDFHYFESSAYKYLRYYHFDKLKEIFPNEYPSIKPKETTGA